jgi:hypothetical protein
MIRIAAAALALAALPALAAVGAPDSRSLSSRYAAWAGGKANADSLVNGLQSGKTVMIVTQGADNTRSLAGFTPPAPMSEDEVDSALSKARSTLSSMGIRQPSADQIQAALIGGEVELGNGRTRLVQGSVTASPEAIAAR